MLAGGRCPTSRHLPMLKRLYARRPTGALLPLQDKNHELCEEIKWHEAQQLASDWEQAGSHRAAGTAKPRARPAVSKEVQTDGRVPSVNTALPSSGARQPPPQQQQRLSAAYGNCHGAAGASTTRVQGRAGVVPAATTQPACSTQSAGSAAAPLMPASRGQSVSATTPGTACRGPPSYSADEGRPPEHEQGAWMQQWASAQPHNQDAHEMQEQQQRRISQEQGSVDGSGHQLQQRPQHVQHEQVWDDEEASLHQQRQHVQQGHGAHTRHSWAAMLGLGDEDELAEEDEGYHPAFAQGPAAQGPEQQGRRSTSGSTRGGSMQQAGSRAPAPPVGEQAAVTGAQRPTVAATGAGLAQHHQQPHQPQHQQAAKPALHAFLPASSMHQPSTGTGSAASEPATHSGAQGWQAPRPQPGQASARPPNRGLPATLMFEGAGALSQARAGPAACTPGAASGMQLPGEGLWQSQAQGQSHAAVSPSGDYWAQGTAAITSRGLTAAASPSGSLGDCSSDAPLSSAKALASHLQQYGRQEYGLDPHLTNPHSQHPGPGLLWRQQQPVAHAQPDATGAGSSLGSRQQSDASLLPLPAGQATRNQQLQQAQQQQPWQQSQQQQQQPAGAQCRQSQSGAGAQAFGCAVEGHGAQAVIREVRHADGKLERFLAKWVRCCLKHYCLPQPNRHAQCVPASSLVMISFVAAGSACRATWRYAALAVARAAAPKRSSFPMARARPRTLTAACPSASAMGTSSCSGLKRGGWTTSTGR